MDYIITTEHLTKKYKSFIFARAAFMVFLARTGQANPLP